MSRLADKIRSTSRVEPGRIGFGVTAERRASPTLLTIVRLDKGQAKSLKDAAGADAIIVSGLEPNGLKEIASKAGDVPLGLELDKADRSSVTSAREAGADFVLLGESAPAEALQEERVGLALRLDGAESDAELRALAGLPLDALETAPPEEPFTIRGLSGVRRLALLGATPLLTEVEAGVSGPRLQALRDAGVVGVIVPGGAVDRLPAVREKILSLPARGRRREERPEAVLPSLAGMSEADEEEPEIE